MVYNGNPDQDLRKLAGVASFFGTNPFIAERDARIAELEAEVKRLNEAGKVLAREAARWWSDCSGESPSAYVEYVNNPTAAAWVREVSK